ncbi:hypothetical protein WR25_00854 [Diploscapter pachys]|uniref:Anaphase-promoting complex subunit 4 WD40 domain-containing protein n=1 Tax=Diploscapter pachys TaxID=2018661 RepID=A0A2A2L5M4_9BILA|nr:hypothetical protein WR25_00854 [Diploscapter pachys]
MAQQQTDKLLKTRNYREGMSSLGRPAVWVTGAATIFTIISILVFSIFYQKGLSGFSNQINAFVSVGDFSSIIIQMIVIIIAIFFVFYLFISFLASVYFIFIGSIYSFCALIDQQCFDFKVLIPAVISKISNKRVDMTFCAEKKELLCSAQNNQTTSFMIAFVAALIAFGGGLFVQNCVVYGLGRRQADKIKWNSEYQLSLPFEVRSASFSPCGKVLLYGDNDGNIHVLQAGTSSRLISQTISIDPTSVIQSIAINPTSDLLAAASNSAKINICQLDPNQPSCSTPIATIPSNTNRPVSVGFVEDLSNGQNMLLIGSRKDIRIIDADSGCTYRELSGKGGTALVESFNACLLVAGSLDESTVSFWDIRSPLPIGHVSTKVKRKSIFSIDSGKNVVALAGDTGIVHLFDMRNYKEITKKKINEEPVKSLRFSPRYRVLAATFQNE